MEGSVDEGLGRDAAGDHAGQLADHRLVRTNLENEAETRVEPVPAQLEVRRVDHPLGLVLTLAGELDLATVSLLQEQLDQAMRGSRVVVIDLSALRFMDSSALQVLVRAEQQLRASDGQLTLVYGPRAVRRVFENHELDRYFTWCDSLGSAFQIALDRRTGSQRICRAHRQPTNRRRAGRRTRRSDVMSTAWIGADTVSRGLFERWQRDKDPRARERLVERYLPLARNLAARYRGRAGEPFDDLLQVASLGLLKALDRFDPDRGTAFSSFAVPTILGELKRHFRDTGWSAHVPRGAQELALKVQKAEQAVSSRLGRSPTAAELAQYMDVTLEQVIDGLEAAAAHHAASLEAPHDELDGTPRPLTEALGEEDPRFEQIDASLTITSAARGLSEREHHVLELRFDRELTQSEIAQRIGVSQMQVSRILRGALACLRELAEPEDHASQPVETKDGNRRCFCLDPARRDAEDGWRPAARVRRR
jgi:RNA polymerase sigma-B factor